MIQLPQTRSILSKYGKMPSENDYFFSLLSIKGLGPARIKKLFEEFKSGENIWHSTSEAIAKVEGFSKLSAEYCRSQMNAGNLRSVNLSNDYQVVSFSDAAYPDNLFDIYDPPAVFYCKGQLLPQDKLSISVVGTRHPGSYGMDVTESLVKGLVCSGITIVSGLAAGIDSMAHKSALQYGGRTIAVFGTAIDIVYPAFNVSLANSIAENGCVISECPPGSVTDKWSFPRRNRIISGLSLGTLVVEGTKGSGSLITAYQALEQGREVFAVPGPIDRQMSEGPHKLIKEGAKLVGDVDDILTELNLVKNNQAQIVPKREFLSPEEKSLMSYISEKKHIDRIQHESSLRYDELSQLLMVLEMKHVVREMPGKIFAPCNK